MINCTFENGNKANLRHTVVDTIVIKDGKILLVKRNKKLIEGGKWGLTGGYMELNETIVEAAKREVYEESGWEIKDLTLIAIKKIDKMLVSYSSPRRLKRRATLIGNPMSSAGLA
jgi:ADP-ribose pyrophosphatase YjhB (NUDIX family)